MNRFKVINLVLLFVFIFWGCFVCSCMAKNYEPQHAIFESSYQGDGRDHIRTTDYWVNGENVISTSYVEILEKSAAARNYNAVNLEDIKFVYKELDKMGYSKISKEEAKDITNKTIVMYIGIENYDQSGSFATEEGVIWITKLFFNDDYRIYLETWSNQSMISALKMIMSM